jgi:hypothetical protein
MRKLSIWLLVTVAAGAFLAGCGGSSNSTSSSSTNPTATSASGGATGSGAVPAVTPKQEVERCKQTVQKLPTLSASAKGKLTTSCEKAGNGAAAHSKLVHEVCFELAARLPSATARARAQKICSAP